MPTDVTAEEIVELLRLEPLPEEGGLYRQTYKDDHSTLIYYLLAGADFSALHVLDAVEVYHWYAGDPLELLLLEPDGSTARVLLGPDFRAGQRPQLVVPAGVWQGSSSTGSWTLIGTTMAPAFSWEAFRLGDRAELIRQYPGEAARIAALTR
ncbi:cupin domain-containing protein [Cellulomonas fimi]|uniref:Cupin domain-containing protein n=1 Tax=Cellulomonas fimi TaxID=1708 RepID=A0A7Y0LWK9_CELFI|nr:cupin domain-containing protein [Cellulomonas fimi]NMR19254.1 cupin domain-containing protein [Cellulomonas fimi]